MKAQKILILCVLTVLLASGLFPPLRESRSPHGSAGYGLIFLTDEDVQVDTTRLLIEWVCLGAITGAVWVLLGVRQERPMPSQVSPP
jgi:hypothetical protein